MAGIEPNGFALVTFAATFTACCLGFFTLIGMFPWSARPPALAGAPAAALVIANLMLMVLLALGVSLYAHRSLRWTSTVVLGGLIFLFVPTLFEIVPDKWRDSYLGLAALVVIQIAALAMLAPPLRIFLTTP